MAAPLEQRRIFEGTYARLVDGTKQAVSSVFIPAMNVVTVASELFVDPANPGTATFWIAIRQGGYSRMFFVSLCGTEVAIEEQNQRPLKFVLENDALAYLQAAIIALGSKRPDSWHS